MKKLLGILVLGLVWCGNVYAAKGDWTFFKQDCNIGSKPILSKPYSGDTNLENGTNAPKLP